MVLLNYHFLIDQKQVEDQLIVQNEVNKKKKKILLLILSLKQQKNLRFKKKENLCAVYANVIL